MSHMYLKSFRHELLNSTREDVPLDKPVAGGGSSNEWVVEVQYDFLFVSLSGGYHLVLLITHCK